MTVRRVLAWLERNADGVAVAASLIALAIVIHIPDVWK